MAPGLWDLKPLPEEQLWLVAADGVKKKEVAKINLRDSVPVTSPLVKRIGKEAWIWSTASIRKRFGNDDVEEVPKEKIPKIYLKENLHIVVDMLAYQIDRGEEIPQRDWTGETNETDKTTFEPSPITKYLHLYMQFDHFGMTKAKNDTMKRMCQLVCKVKFPTVKYWTISRHDLEFILEHEAVEDDDKIVGFVLDAAYVNVRAERQMDTTFFESLCEYGKDVRFLHFYNAHMQKIMGRSNQTGKPAFTNLEALVGPVPIRSKALYEQAKRWWANESGFESLLEEIAERGGEIDEPDGEVDEHDGDVDEHDGEVDRRGRQGGLERSWLF